MSDETTEERIRLALAKTGRVIGEDAIARVLAEELERLDERYARREHEHSPHTPRYR